MAAHFCDGARCAVILGDNIFLDPLGSLMGEANARADHAWVALKQVPDPKRYGVAELRGDRVVSIEEKPARPKSDYAVAGIYIYPPDVFQAIKMLRPSRRGELEITDVNQHYLKEGRIGYSFLDGYWTDAGTFDSLAVANHLVRDAPPRF